MAESLHIKILARIMIMIQKVQKILRVVLHQLKIQAKMMIFVKNRLILQNIWLMNVLKLL